MIGVCVLGDKRCENDERRNDRACVCGVCEMQALIRDKHCENDRTKDRSVCVVERPAWVERRQIGKDETDYGGCEMVWVWVWGGRRQGKKSEGALSSKKCFCLKPKKKISQTG